MMDARGQTTVSAIAAAIGEPARARMLYCLMDGRSRTSTELAIVGAVTPSTASVHLRRLTEARLVTVYVQGRHRYYSLEGQDVASVLEGLSVVAHGVRAPFVPNTPAALRVARTCYDHIAGTLGVWLHDRMTALGWLTPMPAPDANRYDLSSRGQAALEAWGIDIGGAKALRRRFACPCLDWSERRPHVGGALGAALLRFAIDHGWVVPDVDDRSLAVTRLGERELTARFGGCDVSSLTAVVAPRDEGGEAHRLSGRPGLGEQTHGQKHGRPRREREGGGGRPAVQKRRR